MRQLATYLGTGREDTRDDLWRISAARYKEDLRDGIDAVTAWKAHLLRLAAIEDNTK